MAKFDDFLQEQLRDPEWKADYDALEPDFSIMRTKIDVPNAETLAAMVETDEMIRTGGGQHFRGKAADFFAALDAEE